MASLKTKREQYQEINLEKIIEPGGRLRLEIDQEEIRHLANSIESHGLRQAIEVVKRNDKYEIVYGERRVMAHRVLQKKTIWAKVVDLTKDEISLVRALENIARKNLSPIEEAASFHTLKEEFGNTIDMISKKVGQSQGKIKRRLALLNMSTDIQKAVHQKKISVSVAEELWRCKDDTHRSYLLEMCVEHGVTTAIARTWVNDYEKSLRGTGSGNERGGGDNFVYDEKTIYSSCDICDNPVDISQTLHMSVCKTCHKIVKEAPSKGS